MANSWKQKYVLNFGIQSHSNWQIEGTHRKLLASISALLCSSGPPAIDVICASDLQALESVMSTTIFIELSRPVIRIGCENKKRN